MVPELSDREVEFTGKGGAGKAFALAPQ